MGNNHSSIPRSLINCKNQNGKLDSQLYYLYTKRKRQIRRNEELDAMIQQCIFEANDNANVESSLSKAPRTERSCFRRNIQYCRSSDGTLIEVTPRTSSWFCTYVQNPMIDDSKFHQRFRRRFRCSYNCFLRLLKLVQEDDMFLRWSNNDASGRLPSPLELLVLGALRYMGRGWTFDDLEENTSMSEETHRQFFHVFIQWGSTTLYDMFVSYPKQKEEVKLHTNEMEVAGFHGCIGSTDATHVSMARCPSSRSNENLGHKESLPSRSYNITVNHLRQILYTTAGHPARWNDKTLVLFDEFIMGVKNGVILTDYQFQLLEKNEDGIVQQPNYNGCWFLSDNRYQNWSVLVAPMKDAVLYPDIRWSKWVESIRKDVECTFGIMKGRFRILKIGIRLQSIDAVDKLWCTCCALHNMFLDDDGLSKQWDTGVSSDWEGILGMHNKKDTPDMTYDVSGMGYGNNSFDYDDDESDQIIIDDQIINDNNNSKFVHKMKCFDFKQKLIDHFDILFENEQIKWPTRNGGIEPNI